MSYYKKIIYLCMEVDVKQIYFIDLLAIYTNIKSLCCTPEANTVLYGKLPGLFRMYPAMQYEKQTQLLKKIQEALHTFKVGTMASRSSPSCHQLPCYIFLNLTDGLKSLPFQRWLQFQEKTEVTWHKATGLYGG